MVKSYWSSYTEYPLEGVIAAAIAVGVDVLITGDATDFANHLLIATVWMLEVTALLIDSIVEQFSTSKFIHIGSLFALPASIM